MLDPEAPKPSVNTLEVKKKTETYKIKQEKSKNLHLHRIDDIKSVKN